MAGAPYTPLATCLRLDIDGFGEAECWACICNGASLTPRQLPCITMQRNLVPAKAGRLTGTIVGPMSMVLQLQLNHRQLNLMGLYGSGKYFTEYFIEKKEFAIHCYWHQRQQWSDRLEQS